MSESSRSLPDQPSLRFLKLEARRRLAAGEFRALYEAQLAIAREYGFSSWTALKRVVGDSQPDPDEAVLDHLGWVVSRLAGASQPGWAPPGEQELAEHFEQSYLDRVTSGRLIEHLSAMARAGWLRDEVIVITERPRFTVARAGDVQIQAARFGHRFDENRRRPRASHATNCTRRPSGLISSRGAVLGHANPLDVRAPAAPSQLSLRSLQRFLQIIL